MKLHDRVAVITGAGSGIGRAVALSLARRGCHLALADINQAGLDETVALASASGVRVSAHLLDVADREAVRLMPAQVLAAHGRVDLLINNAGVALGGTFAQVSEVDFDWLMEINFHGVVRMTRVFLPVLQASDAARIVNVSSIYGIVSPAGQSAYSASKFAVRGFSNALRHEMEGSSVGVTVVHPGGVATAIARSARVPAGIPEDEIRKRRALMDKMLRLSPEKAGEIIVAGIEGDKARILVGTDAKIASLLERIMPVGYWAILRKGVKA
jgi:NAD(P)-dependent dehydrogenase (short-subunit alcohol dehydrogenase family)